MSKSFARSKSSSTSFFFTSANVFLHLGWLALLLTTFRSGNSSFKSPHVVHRVDVEVDEGHHKPAHVPDTGFHVEF